MIDAGLVAARGVHFLACIALFGELLFAVAIDPGSEPRRRLLFASVAVAVVAAVAWLALEAVAMSGEPAAKALGASVMGRVLLSTQFGQLWIARLALAAAVVVAAGAAARARTTLILAGCYLASLAWSGHAGAGSGARGVLELGADAVHLLAAGAWLGTLPALVSALASERPMSAIVPITQRFSRIGVVSVTAIVASGIANTLLRVGDLHALLTTDYGRLLLVKLVLVAAMLGLAAVNRLALTPRLADDARARRALTRNAALEVALGIAVVGIVGALGITPPPAMGMMMQGH